MLPYRGEFGEAVDFGRLAGGQRGRRARAPADGGARRSASGRARSRSAFRRHLVDLRRGTFDGGAFLDRGRLAIAEYVGRAGSTLSTVFVRDANVAVCLEHKLISLAGSGLRCLRHDSTDPAHRVRVCEEGVWAPGVSCAADPGMRR